MLWALLASFSICLRLTEWPVCGMRLLRLPGSVVVWVAALVRVLNVVSVVYRVFALEVRCWPYRYKVATLGGYIRKVALLASVVAVCL